MHGRALRAAAGYQLCTVTGYNSEAQLWSVVFSEHSPAVELPRLFICFDCEKVASYCDRMAWAFNTRGTAVSWAKYHTYVECMPADESATPADETVKRCVKAATATPALHSTPQITVATPSVAPLIKEMQANYERTMTRIVFDRAVAKVRCADDVVTLPVCSHFDAIVGIPLEMWRWFTGIV